MWFVCSAEDLHDVVLFSLKNKNQNKNKSYAAAVKSTILPFIS